MTGIRWFRIVGFGFLAEIATIAVIIATITVYTMVIAPGGSESAIEAFGQRVGAIIGPIGGTIFTFLGALLATRPLPGRFRLHGLLLGVVTALLTVPGLLSATPSMRLLYVASMLLKLGAGYAAGVLSERRHLGTSSVHG